MIRLRICYPARAGPNASVNPNHLSSEQANADASYYGSAGGKGDGDGEGDGGALGNDDVSINYRELFMQSAGVTGRKDGVDGQGQVAMHARRTPSPGKLHNHGRNVVLVR